MKKENSTPALYSKKSIVKIVICALIVLALTVFCIVLISKNKTDDGAKSDDTRNSSAETSGTPVETAGTDEYTPVDTSVVTDAPDDTQNTPGEGETATVPANESSYENKDASTDVVTDGGANEVSGKNKGYLGKGLYVTSPQSYSGAYVEDGSDEEVSDILAVTLKNTGSEIIRYISFKVYYGETTANFEATTVLPGTSVVVLEKNRITYPGDDFDTCEAIDVAYFDEEPVFYSEFLSISGAEGQFIISNTGSVVVYYKNVKDGRYFGGITYRATSSAGVKASESIILPARHFSPDTCRVMFVTYD